MSSAILFGTGQIGVFVARVLARRGVLVHAADAQPDLAFYARFGPGPDAESPATLDVTDAEAVNAFVRAHSQARVAVFAAGYTGARATADPESARRVATCGVTNVLEAARRHRIRRAVLVSSLAVYGERDDHDRLSVGGPTLPRTTYGQIQISLEKSARAFEQDMDVVILRTVGVFGPKRYGYGSHSSRFIERMLYAAAMGVQRVDVEGSWEDEDDIIYVKDVAEAIAAAALAVDGGSFTINVGLGRVSTLREIADAVRGVFPTAEIVVTPPAQSPQPSRRAPLDVGCLAARLGVKPLFPLTVAMRDYAIETELIHA